MYGRVCVSECLCGVCACVGGSVGLCLYCRCISLVVFDCFFFKYGVFTRQFVVSGRLLFPVVRKESIALETKITIIQPTTPD